MHCCLFNKCHFKLKYTEYEYMMNNTTATLNYYAIERIVLWMECINQNQN